MLAPRAFTPQRTRRFTTCLHHRFGRLDEFRVDASANTQSDQTGRSGEGPGGATLVSARRAEKAHLSIAHHSDRAVPSASTNCGRTGGGDASTDPHASSAVTAAVVPAEAQSTTAFVVGCCERLLTGQPLDVDSTLRDPGPGRRSSRLPCMADRAARSAGARETCKSKCPQPLGLRFHRNSNMPAPK